MKKLFIIFATIMFFVNMSSANEPKKFTAIFKVGETSIYYTDVDSGSVLKEELVSPPENSDSIFMGWYYNDKKWEATYLFEKDSTIFEAKWKIKEEDNASLSKKKSQSKLENALEDESLILYAIGAIAILAIILSIICIVICNNRSCFRNRVIKELSDCDKSDELYECQASLVKKVLEQQKSKEKPSYTPTSYQLKSTDIDHIVRRILDRLPKEEIKEEKKVEQEIIPVVEPQKIDHEVQQPKSLYADTIVDGRFNRVKEESDDDTIFELKLARSDDKRAVIIVYPPAYRRVIANNSFLEGCEKQLLGNTEVTMLREGIAQKDESNGKWIITTTPEVKIS